LCIWSHIASDVKCLLHVKYVYSLLELQLPCDCRMTYLVLPLAAGLLMYMLLLVVT